jgi:hypothetical protein
MSQSLNLFSVNLTEKKRRIWFFFTKAVSSLKKEKYIYIRSSPEYTAVSSGKSSNALGEIRQRPVYRNQYIKYYPLKFGFLASLRSCLFSGRIPLL